MTTLRAVLLLVACLSLTLLPVRADLATCDPACDPNTAKQCATMTNGPNRCIDVIGYGTCTHTSDCPAEDGFSLTCVVGECVPTQFFQFTCSDNNPCTSPEVCTHYILPDTDSNSGWCVPAGSLYSPCTQSSECTNYNVDIISVECRDGYCQVKGVDAQIPCTADAQVQCTLGCDTTTGFCKVDNTNPNPPPVAAECSADSQDQCGIYGCDLSTGKCKTAPTSDNPNGDGLGAQGAASNIHVGFSLLFVAMMAALVAIRM